VRQVVTGVRGLAAPPTDNLEAVNAWADGLYVKAGLEDTNAALPVIIGALSDGRKAG
jgi:hypothetical protein